MKKLLIGLFTVMLITGCSIRSTSTTTGTLVKVSAGGLGKVCDYGSIGVQPASSGGDILYIFISDMTELRKREIEKYLNKKIQIEVNNNNPVIGCSSSEIKIMEIN